MRQAANPIDIGSPTPAKAPLTGKAFGCPAFAAVVA
jgi:hypothetical protein